MLTVSLGCALVVLVTETILLDRKIGIFSGGYLAEYRLSGVRTAVYVVLNLLSSVAVIGPLVAATLWLSTILWMHTVARGFLAASVALGVVGIAEIAMYELGRYLGDLVNVGVLVDLVGGDIREILHFSASPALHWLGTASLLALLATGASVLLDRWFPSRMRQEPGARRRTLRTLLAVLVLALVAGAAARRADPAIDRALSYTPAGRVLGSVTQWLTDVDRDGYGLLSVPRDPAPFDARIHPYAPDIPGNGIDENGVGGDLPVGPVYRDPIFPAVEFTHHRDVVFVILESFRADAVDASLGGRDVAPHVRRLARDGAAARLAFSHNGFTVQSRYHAFTGHLIGPGDPGSIIDDFNANGYETAFFSAQDESFGDDFVVGFDRAAVRYDARADRDRRFTQFSTPASLTVSWKVLEERVNAFLDHRDSTRPLFLHLNIQDGHFPYTNPDIVPLLDSTTLQRHEFRESRVDDLRRMYLNTIANVDAALGRMLARVEATTGRAPGVLVIADHGESLFDEGFLGHGYAADDAQTRIPFILHNLPAAVPAVAGQLDVRPVLRAAMTAVDPLAAPAVDDSVDNGAFQYVGILRAPKAIAQVSADGTRLTVNLRRPGHLEGAALALVHFWERVVLATGRRGDWSR